MTTNDSKTFARVADSFLAVAVLSAVALIVGLVRSTAPATAATAWTDLGGALATARSGTGEGWLLIGVAVLVALPLVRNLVIFGVALRRRETVKVALLAALGLAVVVLAYVVAFSSAAG